MFIVPCLLGYFQVGGNSVNSHFLKYVTLESFVTSAMLTLFFLLSYYLVKNKHDLYIKTEEKFNFKILILFIFISSIFFKISKISFGLVTSYGSNITNILFDAYLYIFGVNILNIILLNLMFAKYYLDKKIGLKFNLFGFFSYSFFFILFINTVISDGRKFYIAAMIISIIMLRHFIYKKISFAYLIFPLVLLFVLFPTKNFLRDLNSLKPYIGIEFRSSLGHEEKLSFARYIYPKSQESIKIFNANAPVNEPYIQPSIKTDSSKIYDLYSDTFLGRINQSHIFSIIILQSHKYGFGQTIKDSFSLAPNSIPTKPFDNIWVDTGLIDKSENTSIGTTIFGDLYRNFTLLGACLGIALLAITYKYFYLYFCNTESVFRLIIYTSMFPFLIFVQEGTFDSMLVMLSKFILSFTFIYLVNKFLNYKKIDL